MKRFLLGPFLAAWVVTWLLCYWLEVGPCAWIIELQLWLEGEQDLHFTLAACSLAALVPVALLMWKTKVSPSVFVTLRWFAVALLGFAIFAFYQFRTRSEPPHLSGVNDIGSIASMVGHDFTANDLLKSFDLENAVVIKRTERYQVNNDVYFRGLPALREASAPPTFLLLNDVDPATLLDAQSRGVLPSVSLGKSPSAPHTEGWGTTWLVRLQPLPYLVRRGFHLDQTFAFGLIVTAGHHQASNWMWASIVSLTFGVVLAIAMYKQ